MTEPINPTPPIPKSNFASNIPVLPGVTNEPKPKIPVTLEDETSKARLYIAELKTHYLAFGGKEGFNPYFFLNQILNPLELKLNKEPNLEIINKILALKKETPTLDTVKQPSLYRDKP